MELDELRAEEVELTDTARTGLFVIFAKRAAVVMEFLPNLTYRLGLADVILHGIDVGPFVAGGYEAVVNVEIFSSDQGFIEPTEILED